MFTEDLEKILKLRSKIVDDLVFVEACYLSQQLEALKSPWYAIWADKRDLPAINLGLQLLKPLKKYSVANNAKQKLEQVKIKLFNSAIKPPQTPGKLFIALENLVKSGMITISGFSVDLKSNFQQSLI
jgi:hypothetical protein